MVRTPEEKREKRDIAEEFRQQFRGKPGKKAIQRILRPGEDYENVPQNPPRGKNRPHPPIDWMHLVRVSSVAQADIAASLRESERIAAGFDQVIQQIENHPGQLAVPDANVWLHGISSQEPRPYCWTIVDMIEDKLLAPCVSRGVIAEITNVGRLMLGKEELSLTEYERLMTLVKMAINVDPLPLRSLMEQRLILPEDQSDAKFLVVAQKTHRFSQGEPVPVVSMDDHLLKAPEDVLGEVKVMNPGAFLEWLKNL